MSAQDDFFKAVMAGNTAEVEALLAADPTLARARTDSGASAVLLAAYYGEPQLARMLAERDPHINIFEAAAIGNAERLASILAEQPESANIVAPDGFTPLGLTAFFGHLDAARTLLGHGADANMASQNAQRVAPIHSSVASQNLAITELLIQNGASINAVQQDGFTPLLEAVQNKQPAMVDLLLRHGADPTQAKDDGTTPLALARKAGDEVIVRMLEAAGTSS